MAYFDGVKVGDTIWVAGVGEGKVFSVRHYGFEFRNSFIQIDRIYNFRGQRIRGDMVEPYQTAFWSEPVISIPPRPKRMMEKEIKGWVGFAMDSELTIYPRVTLFKSEADANSATGEDFSIPKAIKVCHRYREEVSR